MPTKSSHIKGLYLLALAFVFVVTACEESESGLPTVPPTPIAVTVRDPDVLVQPSVPRSALDLLGVDEMPMQIEVGDGYQFYAAPTNINYIVSVNGSAIEYTARLISFTYDENGNLEISYVLDFSGDTVVTGLTFNAYGLMICSGTAWDFWKLSSEYIQNQGVVKPPTNIRELRIRECPPTPKEADARATTEAAATATSWAKTPEGNRTPEVLGTPTPLPLPTLTELPVPQPTETLAVGR